MQQQYIVFEAASINEKGVLDVGIPFRFPEIKAPLNFA